MKARLCMDDGTTFDKGPLQQLEEAEPVKKRKRKRHNKGTQHPSVLKAAAAAAAAAADEASGKRTLYDRVLVDAECTHDGSIRHLEKYATCWGWDSLERRLLDQERIQTITTLQGKLLRNGFRLLKPGGELVYSTCSLSQQQNEVINCLLSVLLLL